MTANVAFGLRPVRRLLLRRRRRRLRGIVHPLQHAHDGVEPRLRVLALLARPPASNPRGELRRGSSMQDGQQAKLTLPCVGRGIPERNVAGVGGSAERPEEATAVCARAHLWLAAAALRDAADLSSCAHHVCGEPKPALVCPGSWMTHVTTPVARLSRKLPDGTSAFSRLHRVLVWARTEASASNSMSRHVLLRKSHHRASREGRVDAPGKSPCCDARRRTSETPVVGVRVVRRAWLRHSAARNSGTHNFEDHRRPLSPPVVGGVLLLFLVDGAHQRNQQVQQHLHAEHMSDAVGRSNSRAVQHGLQYSALP